LTNSAKIDYSFLIEEIYDKLPNGMRMFNAHDVDVILGCRRHLLPDDAAYDIIDIMEERGMILCGYPYFCRVLLRNIWLGCYKNNNYKNDGRQSIK
jgi:hypothetical protein